MDTPTERIGIRQLADRLAVPLSTLHYWERRGLLQAHRRGGQRYYDPDQLHRATLIRMWQATGQMSLDEIAVVLRGRTESSTWRDAVTGRVDAIASQLARLEAARGYLVHMLGCPRDNPAMDCPKLRDQADRATFAREPTGVVDA